MIKMKNVLENLMFICALLGSIIILSLLGNSIVNHIDFNNEREVFCKINVQYDYDFCIDNYVDIDRAITQNEIERGLNG